MAPQHTNVVLPYATHGKAATACLFSLGPQGVALPACLSLAGRQGDLHVPGVRAPRRRVCGRSSGAGVAHSPLLGSPGATATHRPRSPALGAREAACALLSCRFQAGTTRRVKTNYGKALESREEQAGPGGGCPKGKAAMDKRVRWASAQGLVGLGESAVLPALSQGMGCGQGRCLGREGDIPVPQKGGAREEALKSVHKLSPVRGRPGAAQAEVSPWSRRRQPAVRSTRWRSHRASSV